jgi:hypothetical protein
LAALIGAPAVRLLRWLKAPSPQVPIFTISTSEEKTMSQDARKSLVAVSLLAVCLLVAIPVVAQKPPVPQPIPVSVQNTPNVNVTNTPSVNVANTPTVTLSGGASVAVTNPLDGQGNPTPLATLEAVQLYGAFCIVEFSSRNGGACDLTAIPAGKELVVQEFDAVGRVEPGNRPLLISLEDTITGYNVFPYTFMANDGRFDYLATHQETRLYVLPGYLPICVVELPAGSLGSYVCNISGFLVDVPSGQQAITVQNPKPLSQLLRKLPGR